MKHKQPYQPSERKRFEISADEFSRKRIEVLKEIQQEMSDMFEPIKIAFSLFGSLSKGKTLSKETAPGADIDLVCFIEIDNLYEHLKQLAEKNKGLQEIFEAVKAQCRETRMTTISDESKNHSAYCYLERYIGKFIFEKLNEQKEIMGYDNDTELFKDIRFSPISQEGWLYSIMAATENLALMMAHIEEEEIEPEELEGCKMRLARYFHLDIGGGLKSYRQHFLSQLKTLRETEPDKAEYYWSLVNDAVREIERKFAVPEKIQKQFPGTLDEAIKYYGVAK
jgi:hypothetical protein